MEEYIKKLEEIREQVRSKKEKAQATEYTLYMSGKEDALNSCIETAKSMFGKEDYNKSLVDYYKRKCKKYKEAIIEIEKENEELKEALKVCKFFSNEISQYCKETLKDKKMMKGGYAYQICCKWKDGLKKSFEMLGDEEDE